LSPVVERFVECVRDIAKALTTRARAPKANVS
jgi:hypothetical protein